MSSARTVENGREGARAIVNDTVSVDEPRHVSECYDVEQWQMGLYCVFEAGIVQTTRCREDVPCGDGTYDEHDSWPMQKAISDADRTNKSHSAIPYRPEPRPIRSLLRIVYEQKQTNYVDLLGAGHASG
jgi:hypothetical protein